MSADMENHRWEQFLTAIRREIPSWETAATDARREIARVPGLRAEIASRTTTIAHLSILVSQRCEEIARLTAALTAAQAEVERLRSLVLEWSDAVDLVCPDDHRPSVAKERIARLVSQANEAARLLGDLNAATDRLALVEPLAGAVEGLLDVLARVEAGFPPGPVEDASRAALKAWRGGTP